MGDNRIQRGLYMSNRKWKKHLLSSSFPLEFDAAKILVSKGFSVKSDYTYSRNDSGVVKDFSVDIKASTYTPFTNPDKITADVSLLVECKYRSPNIKWLFLPDPNDPDYSPITLGNTINIVDAFSPFLINRDASSNFDANLPEFCYKGTELNFSTGEVYDSELKHGISQLQYALPRLFAEGVEFNIFSHPDDNVPLIFSSILLTTANLFVIDNNTSLKDVLDASDINDLITQVPYLLFYSDYGPDFSTHCSKECSSLAELGEYKVVDELESLRLNSKHKTYEFENPSVKGKDLATAQRYELKRYFTQFLVCTYTEFPMLIDSIKKTISQALKTRKHL